MLELNIVAVTNLVLEKITGIFKTRGIGKPNT